MTVYNTVSKTRVNGDGAVVDFTFDFPVQVASDLVVKKVLNSTEVATLQTSPDDYTVVLNTVTEGGTVTYTVAPLATEDSFIKRTLDLEQGTNIPTEDNFPEVTVENEIDRSRMIDIQLNEQFVRTIQFPETSLLENIAAPEGIDASNRATKLWGWDATGIGLTLYTPTLVDAVSVIASKGDIVQGSDAGIAEKLIAGDNGDLLEYVSGKLASVSAPTIADHTNAQHDHSNTVQGGTIASTIRSIVLRFEPGATPNTNIDITDISAGNGAYNYPTITSATDLAYSGSSGSFALNAGGTTITMDITETITGILGTSIQVHDLNTSHATERYDIIPLISSGNLLISFVKSGTFTDVDITSILDAGDKCDAMFTFVTST